MTTPRRITVRVKRTRSFERNESSSLRRRNSKGKLSKINDQDQRAESMPNNVDHPKVKVVPRRNSPPRTFSVKKNMNGRSIRVIYPNSSSTAEPTTSNAYNIPLKSSHPTQSTGKDLITKNQSASQKPMSASSHSLPCATKSDIDARIVIDRFHMEDPKDTSRRFKYARSNLLSHQANPNNSFTNAKTENPKRQKRRRRGGFFGKPFCLPICGLLTVLLLSGIAALIVALLNINKAATTTTTTGKTIISINSTAVITSTNTSSTTMSTASTASTTTGATTAGTSTTVVTTSITSITSTTTKTTTASTSTTTTTKSFTSTTSTTTSTTTITKPICGTSCLNQTWTDDPTLLAKFKFENDYSDETGQYNGTGINNPPFVEGFVGEAVSFSINASQMVSAAYIPLANNSYSIDTWIYPTSLLNSPHNSICGICTAPSNDLCLHMTVRNTSSIYYLYHGFYGDDTNSNAQPVLINQWIHTAFTFDVQTRIQTVYYNGILLRNKTTSSAFIGMTGNFQIGHIPNLTIPSLNNIFQGYIDELSVSGRVKSACEILDQATLAVRFSFDESDPLSDQGPNSISSNGSNYVIVTGNTLNGMSFISSSPSYLQASGFLSLGIANQPFSISFWIKPTSLAGTIVHQSNTSFGSDFCITYLGFASNGSLIAQVLTNTGYIGISYSSLSLTTFSHIVQTWSSTNGLRLYVNNILIATQTASTTVASSAWVNYMTIGSCLSGCGTCNTGNILAGQFVGILDDFRVYIRELTAADVCAAYAYGLS